MVAIKCGATKTYITDKISADTPQIQKLQRKNLSKNLTKSEFKCAQIAVRSFVSLFIFLIQF